MASLAVRRAGSAPASTSLGRAGGAPYDTSGGCVLGAGTPLTRRPARRLRRPGLRPVRMPHRLHLQHGRARRHQTVTVLHRPGRSGGHPLHPVRLDEVRVLCLRPTRQAGIPGDRVAGLDAGCVPAGIALARGDLELALGEADRAALVVARPSARGALPCVPLLERGQRLPVAAARPGSPPARRARSGRPGPAARAAPAAAGPRRRTGWRRRAGRRAAPPPPP